MAQAYLEHNGLARRLRVFCPAAATIPRFSAGCRSRAGAGVSLSVTITTEELAWLEGTGRFSSALLHFLETFQFTGDVDAMPEGTLFFANEPVLRVVAPLPMAQLVETRIMNLLNFQIMIASKAARSILVASGKPVIDFGLRRAHGAEAGLLAARASYLAGFSGTATVLAGMHYGVPIYGTMAHAFVQAHDDETAAFEHFAQAQPDNTFLLIDTYDTETAAKRVVRMSPDLKRKGIPIKGVRLDSGDLAEHACNVRRILDEGGLEIYKFWPVGTLTNTGFRPLSERRADRQFRRRYGYDDFSGCTVVGLCL